MAAQQTAGVGFSFSFLLFSFFLPFFLSLFLIPEFLPNKQAQAGPPGSDETGERQRERGLGGGIAPHDVHYEILYLLPGIIATTFFRGTCLGTEGGGDSAF